MNTVLRSAALAVALTFSGAASAQQAAHGVRVGLGVGLPTSELSSLFAGGPLMPAQIYLPIDLSPNFRLEPQAGILATKQDGGDEASYYTLGAGAFYMMPLAQQAHLYVGGRFVLGWDRSESVTGGGFVEKTSGSDVSLAGAFGGEILPHPRLGVGAEAQVGHTWIGDRDTTTAGGTTTTPGGSSTQTQGVIFVRVYFN